MRSVKNRLKQLEQATAILDSYNLVLIDSEDGATLDIVANRHDGSGELAHVDTIKEFNNFFRGKSVGTVHSIVPFVFDEYVADSVCEEVFSHEKSFIGSVNKITPCKGVKDIGIKN